MWPGRYKAASNPSHFVVAVLKFSNHFNINSIFVQFANCFHRFWHFLEYPLAQLNRIYSHICRCTASQFLFSVEKIRTLVLQSVLRNDFSKCMNREESHIKRSALTALARPKAASTEIMSPSFPSTI